MAEEDFELALYKFASVTTRLYVNTNILALITKVFF